jgi:hypothetical protein
MSTDNAVHAALGADEPAVRRWWSWVSIGLASGLFLEAVFAGAMMSGAAWARAAHMANAALLVAAALVAGLVALATLRRLPHGLRFALTLLGLAAAVLLQAAIGRAAGHGAPLLWLHVPLGVALVGLATQSIGLARRLGDA